MMPSIPNEIHLAPDQQQLLAHLAARDEKPWEVVLTEALKARAQDNASLTPSPTPRQAGHGKGTGWMAPDFDDPLPELLADD